MRLSILFLFVNSISVALANHTYAQNTWISVHLNNEAISGILDAVEKQSDFTFIYDSKVVDVTRKVTVRADNQNIFDILNQMFSGSGIAYTVINKKIILNKEETFTSVSQPAITISGVVTDMNGEPMPGVNVVIKGTTQGVVTDVDGKYSLGVPNNNVVLQFSFVGYITQEIVAGNRASITVQLAEDTQQLEEIVVVGYGTQKKVNLTGSVDLISDKDLENKSMPNLTQGLQGIVPNLNIVMGDGKPIQSPEYNIRGTTSISAAGGSALILIDGVEGDPSLLNPNDIASISVLKDASSAAIYGARGVFGVVLITTKNPVKDKISVNYSANYSVKSVARFPETEYDGYTFASMFNEAWSGWNDYSQTPQNVNKTVKFSQEYLEEFARRKADPSLPRVDVNSNGEYVYYESVDYFSELYKKRFGAMDQNISISGSSEKSGFYITGRYYGQDGLFRYNTDDYKIYNFRAKGYIQVTDWLRIDNNMDYSNMTYHNPLNVGEGGGIWRNIADEGHPMAPIFNPDGNLSFSAAYTVGDFWYGRNGIDMKRRVFRNTTGFTAEFFDKKFRVKGDFTIQHKDIGEKRVRVQVPYSRKPGVIEYVGTNYNDIREKTNTTQYMATNIYTEYENTFREDHYFKGMVGYNYEQSTFQNLQVQRNGLITPDATDISLAIGEEKIPEGGWDKWAILGGFFRVNYVYKGRYLIEVNGRYDGSSKFPYDQRYAFFPSVSVGWRIAKEGFWNVDPKYITDLKIRASYGSLGNGNVASYSFQEQLKLKQSALILNGVKPQMTSQPDQLPDGLTWETATTQNIGLDFALLSNRLTFSGDMYIRKTKDMYTKGPTLPGVYGTKEPKGNYADLKTKGWEFSIGWKDQFEMASKPFTYDVRFSLSDYQAEITKYNNEEKRLDDYYSGQKVNEIWGFTTEGYFTKENLVGAPDQSLLQVSSSRKPLPGDIKFVDKDLSGKIDKGNNRVGDSGDMEVIGNSTPRFAYGLNLGADWNNFFFSVFIQGIGKQDWWPGAEADMFWGMYNRPYNKIPKSHMGNIWSEDNPDAYFPRLRGYKSLGDNDRELSAKQTKYLQNVAYIRLKNLQFGYSLPQQLVSKIHMSSARVYISCDNLWSWSPLYKNIKEIDVENIGGSDKVVTEGKNGNGNNYPILRTISLGMSIGF